MIGQDSSETIGLDLVEEKLIRNTLNVPCLDNSQLNWTENSQYRNYLTAVFEPIQLEVFIDLIKRFTPELVLDVGANIGVYGILASQVGNSEVLIFEAADATADECAANIQINKLGKRITLHRTAVSDKDGEIEFWDEGNLSGRNSVNTTSIHQGKGGSIKRVASVTIDNLVKQVDKLIVMKIDTEGHEAEVLSGAKKMLSSNRCIVQCEAGYKQGRACETLNGLGYEKLLGIGPDLYYSNFCRSEIKEAIVVTLENRLVDVLKERVEQDDMISRLNGRVDELELKLSVSPLKRALNYVTMKIAFRSRVKRLFS